MTQLLHSQGNGVVAFDIPARNSLKFNRYITNPTFSFVRESNRYISLNNKRQWTQFDNNPETYLFSYAGRLNEDMGIGLGLFQQNYGILTTFGGVANYAYNVVIDRSSNLTFGVNAGFYQSTINDGKIITNFPDPSLENIESNSLITVNPGINYGIGLFDVGLSMNNAVLYNLKSSELIEDNPEQSLQAHGMYTGYMSNSGFFDQSKFSMLVVSEFKKDNTVLSGLLLLATPKGIWAQAGYNTVYGVTCGLGLNITSQIAIEYNFETSLGELSNFGSSHDITLAYKFRNTDRYTYSDEDDEEALISPENFKKRKPSKRAKETKITAKTKELAEARRARIEAERIEKQNAEQQAIDKAIKDAEQERLDKIEEEKRELAKAEEEARLKAEQDKIERARLAAELKASQEAKAIEAARLVEVAKAREIARQKAEEEAKAREITLQQEEKAKAEAAEKERLRLEAQAREDAKAQELLDAQKAAELDAQNKAMKEAEEQKRLEREALEKERLAQEAMERDLAEAQAKKDAEERANNLPTDATTQSLANLTKVTESTDTLQQNLLDELEEKIAVKREDLRDLKEENDLSEQGIYTAPKPFKSLTAENNALNVLKSQIETNIENQNERIKRLEALLAERLKTVPNRQDDVNVDFQNAINDLKNSQVRSAKLKTELDSTLKQIEIATDFERKRRIKRAAYDNEADRYNKDRATLKNLLQTTPLATTALTEDDFDFGETRSDIQILKNVQNIDSGYYLVIAAHSNVAKRDEFLKKAIASGRRDINFFYDINTSKYYIYYKKFNVINEAERALEEKGDRPYNGKMSMVKIEN